jgi:hypothetical protein
MKNLNSSSNYESQALSTVLTLQTLNKEAEKKEAAAEGMRTRCKICFKEIAPKRLCNGHGGGGGGGGGDKDADPANALEKQAILGNQFLPGKLPESLKPEEWVIGFNPIEDDPELDAQIDEESFDPKIIAELVDNGLLAITMDRESKTFSIELKCEPGFISKKQRHELKKYMNAVLKEWNEFKKENHISDDCLNLLQDKEGNILFLGITFERLSLYYDRFIQQLANNLLPTPKSELQAKEESQKVENSTPTPLKNEPTLNKVEYPDDLVSNTMDDGISIFNPSPLSTENKVR